MVVGSPHLMKIVATEQPQSVLVAIFILHDGLRQNHVHATYALNLIVSDIRRKETNTDDVIV